MHGTLFIGTGTMDLPRRALGPVRARRAPHGPEPLGDHLTGLAS